ncbi:hypothetical protein [Streptomyces axinellae]|uniref:Transcriptional regulator n=1 Tax=Streptomyces axinellae TaxID=552788 RepID=A0ABP6CJD4_9ACTN
MGQRSPNDQLAALLAESGWSGGELARAVNALGTKYGLRLRYDRTAVAHWLEGSRPRPPVPGLVAQSLGRRLGRAIHVGETGLGGMAGGGASTDTVLKAGDPVERLIALCGADADTNRRLALNRRMLTDVDIQPPAWPPAAGPQDGPPDGAVPNQAPHGDARLSDMVTVFAELTYKYGGAHARSALGAYITDDVTPRLVPSPDGEAADPLVLAGSACLSHLLGTMAADAGLPNLGYHCYRSALDLAYQAGNRNVYAITLRTMAQLALRLDDMTRARQWSERALEVADPTATTHVLSYLYAGRAVVLAVEGERENALADLLAAENSLDTEADPAPLRPFTVYPPAAFLYQRGEVLLSLGDRGQAVTAFQQSLAARSPAHHIALVLTHAHIAETLLSLGEVEAALEQCREIFVHYPFTASRRTTMALTAMRRCLAPYRRHPQAREVRDQLIHLTRRKAGVAAP